jgi:uncharacterized membrane protein
MTRHLLTYLATLLAVGVLDALWLGVIARGWYAQGLGHLMAERPFWPAAAGFYLLYPVGLLVFAVLPSGGDGARALLLGAAAGLFAYGTYDLTNLAVMRAWPWKLALLDIAWGTFVSATGAWAGAWAARAVGLFSAGQGLPTA